MLNAGDTSALSGNLLRESSGRVMLNVLEPQTRWPSQRGVTSSDKSPHDFTAAEIPDEAHTLTKLRREAAPSVTLDFSRR
jgi:hypothetical protein